MRQTLPLRQSRLASLLCVVNSDVALRNVEVDRAVRFQSGDSTLWGRFSVPDSTGHPQPLVVMVTGDGLRGSRKATYTDLRNSLDAAGLASFIFDFQGLGESGGPARKLSLSVGVANLKDAIARARAETWVDPSKVAILGSSFGGNCALLYTAEDPYIATLALKSPVSFYPETHEVCFGADRMAAWKETGYDDRYGFEYEFYLDSFSHNTYAAAHEVRCPVFIVHGDADRNVPLRQSLRLLDCLPNARLEVLPGVEHNYEQGNALDVMTRHMVQWLSEILMTGQAELLG